MAQQVAVLKHGDLVTIKGKKGKVGTVGGYAAEYNDDPIAAIQKAQANGEDLFWVNQQATMLGGDKGYYEAERVRWADAITLTDGQPVWLEGQLLKTRYKGDYADMVTFTQWIG